MERQEKGVRIGPSPLGLGVFAGRAFRPGEMIGRIQGDLVRDPDYESDYCIELSGETCLEPGPPFRYLNHSCRPNCALVRMEDGDEAHEEAPELWVEVIAEIRPGDQLTIDYAWPAEAAIPCGCGSPHCRGWVVAEAQLARLAAPPPPLSFPAEAS